MRSTSATASSPRANGNRFALAFVSPLGLLEAARAIDDPIAIAAGIGVGVSSSVIPYVCDQLAMARLARATYALLVCFCPRWRP